MGADWNPTDYPLMTNLANCTSCDRTFWADLSDEKLKQLEWVLRDEYVTRDTDDFALCSVATGEEQVYAVSFRRIKSGKGRLITVWVAIVVWDTEREQWELRAVEQTDSGSLA